MLAKRYPILSMLPLILAMFLLVHVFSVKSNISSLRHGGASTMQVMTSPDPVIIPKTTDEIWRQRQRTAQDELSQVFFTDPATGSSNEGRKGTGDACIGPVCGLGLFFASIGLTFVACFVVIYIADKRYDHVQNSRRRRDNCYESMRKRRPSNSHLDFRRNGAAMRRRAVH